MANSRDRRPGDLLLEHYLPDADEDTRERARSAFRDFAFFLLRMGERLDLDARSQEDSTESKGGATISEALPEPPP
jgi:hypothetical protein